MNPIDPPIERRSHARGIVLKDATIITDDGISDEAARMVEDAGVELLVVGAVRDGKTAAPPDEEDSSSVA